MEGRSSTFGIDHGSAPVPRNASERYTTGVMYFSARRQASTAYSKHSDGVAGATTAECTALQKKLKKAKKTKNKAKIKKIKKQIRKLGC